MFLAYAAVRVVVMYSVSISEAVWLNELPGVLAIAVRLIASARAGKQLPSTAGGRKCYGLIGLSYRGWVFSRTLSSGSENHRAVAALLSAPSAS